MTQVNNEKNDWSDDNEKNDWSDDNEKNDWSDDNEKNDWSDDNENKATRKQAAMPCYKGKLRTEKLFCQKYASGTQKYSSIAAFF